MNLDALVTKGRLPWSPSPDAHDPDVWYTYEYPRVGTFTVKGVTVLFDVFGGVETEMTTVWAYAALEPSEADELAEVSFDSVTELQEFVQEKLNGRQLVFALADDRGDLYEVATTFLDQVLQQSRAKLDAGTRFRAKLAEVDAAAHDLVEA